MNKKKKRVLQKHSKKEKVRKRKLAALKEKAKESAQEEES